MHDPFFNVVDIGWIDLKTVYTYSMAMIPHRFNYRVDFYHAMACFFCVEDGLFWKPDQKSCYQKAFPNLHNIKDGAFSRKLTDLIRKYIPNGASDEVRNSFSAKSTRRGAINYMDAPASTD
jgi:hypothetical protein